MHHDPAAEALRGARRDRRRVALDDEVELVRIRTQERVPDRAAHDVYPRLARQRAQRRMRAERLDQIFSATHAGHHAPVLLSCAMSPERHPRRRRRILIGIAALIVVLVGAGAVYALTRGGDVNNPDVEFHAEPTQTPVPESTPEPSKKKGK